MIYHGQNDFQHTQQASIGILVTNLGTPEAPTRKALRTYLAEFLSDQRVVELPRMLWKPILHGIILNLRPAKSAKLYESIWTDQGSPLAAITSAITSKLERRINDNYGARIIVGYAMRYGKPSIGQAINQLLDSGVEKLIVLPLYPQYASSTVGSTMDALGHSLAKRRWVPELRFINCYYDHPTYISACSQQIENFRQKNGSSEKLVLSFHGLPENHRDNGDPYFCHCLKTARLIAEHMSLSEADYVVTFQSRFGKQEWLKPYTDKTLIRLAKEGVKSVDVFCPGFSADCLETLEEITVENRDNFINAGGKNYHYIPALNDSEPHIELLEQLCAAQCSEWLTQLRDAEQTEVNHARIAKTTPTSLG